MESSSRHLMICVYMVSIVNNTSVDAKHHGASLSERWNVTWVGNNSIYTH